MFQHQLDIFRRFAPSASNSIRYFPLASALVLKDKVSGGAQSETGDWRRSVQVLFIVAMRADIILTILKQDNSLIVLMEQNDAVPLCSEIYRF